MSRRLSLGGRSTPLGDGLSRTNSSSFRSETPVKDRHVRLEEWRQSRGAVQDNNDSLSKRPRLNEGPRLPPSAASSNAASLNQDGTTALERFRKRKLMMHQQQTNSSFEEGNQTINSFNTSYYDDQDDTTTISGFSLIRRGGSCSGRARRMTMMPSSSTRQSFLAPEPLDVLAAGSHHLHNNNYYYGASNAADGVRNSLNGSGAGGGSVSMSQLTVDSDTFPQTISGAAAEEAVGLVESAGLRSQVHEMKLRIEQLEKEKMGLSMDMAPLVARIRQMDDEWIEKENRYEQMIQSLKVEAREADERYRDLQIKYEATEVEAKHLRLEVRKASSTHLLNNNTNVSASNSTWSRNLQIDRDVTDLKGKLRSTNEDLNLMQLAKVSVEKELQATRIELDAMTRSFNELRHEYDEIAQSTDDNRDAEIRLEVLQNEHIATSAQLNAVASELAATKARADAVQSAKEEQYKREVDMLHFEISVLKTRAGNTNKSSKSSESPDEEDVAVLIARIEERDRRISELEVELLQGEELRRQLHNRIQELRGNIRVFVRTRPFLPNDKQQDRPAIEESLDNESLSIADARSSSNHSFKFDRVFPPSSGQDQVFDEVKDFVQSALDGYQVCLFSYGQTGSGKTHTMQGSGIGAMRGIIPRAVEQILMQSKVMQKQKWEFNLTASFLEIYNENLKDLLATMASDKSVRQNPPKLAIRRTQEGKSYVDGLTEVQIETNDSDAGMMQLGALMEVAARSRSVASTKMNAQSSRSHSVFMLHIRGYNTDSNTEVHGSLNLCDLAGSERLDRSGAGQDAQRLKETQAINKSLSCLGDVFNALSKGATHVPYRNSKLTYLLQDCLSGDGKALMFVNLSPTTASSNESLCSLRFAQRVNQVELGKPTKNIQYKN